MRKTIGWLVAGFLFIFIIYTANNYTSSTPLTDEFVGTYTYNTDFGQYLMSIDPRDGNSFFYANFSNDHLIRGKFSQKAEDIYFLWCDNAKNSEIIAQQEIINQNQSFTMTISGQQITFKKIMQAPLIYTDKQLYD